MSCGKFKMLLTTPFHGEGPTHGYPTTMTENMGMSRAAYIRSVYRFLNADTRDYVSSASLVAYRLLNNPLTKWWKSVRETERLGFRIISQPPDGENNQQSIIDL